MLHDSWIVRYARMIKCVGKWEHVLYAPFSTYESSFAINYHPHKVGFSHCILNLWVICCNQLPPTQILHNTHRKWCDTQGYQITFPCYINLAEYSLVFNLSAQSTHQRSTLSFSHISTQPVSSVNTQLVLFIHWYSQIFTDIHGLQFLSTLLVLFIPGYSQIFTDYSCYQHYFFYGLQFLSTLLFYRLQFLSALLFFYHGSS